MFKEVSKEKFYHLINHGPCVLVTSGEGENSNVCPIAWTTPVNDDPQLLAIAVAEDHYTSELILKTKEFVINVPNEDFLPKVMLSGKTSGRKENKIKKLGLSIKLGKKVKTPILTDCIGFIECRLKDKITYEGVNLFIGEVLNCGAKKDLYDEYWIPEKAKTIHHLGGKHFAVMNKKIIY